MKTDNDGYVQTQAYRVALIGRSSAEHVHVQRILNELRRQGRIRRSVRIVSIPGWKKRGGYPGKKISRKVAHCDLNIIWGPYLGHDMSRPIRSGSRAGKLAGPWRHHDRGVQDLASLIILMLSL